MKFKIASLFFKTFTTSTILKILLHFPKELTSGGAKVLGLFRNTSAAVFGSGINFWITNELKMLKHVCYLFSKPAPKMIYSGGNSVMTFCYISAILFGGNELLKKTNLLKNI